jgi:hypothetical protein
MARRQVPPVQLRRQVRHPQRQVPAVCPQRTNLPHKTIRKFAMSNYRQHLLCFVVSALSLSMPMAKPLLAQNYGSSGQSWTSNWGFSSVGDRSLNLQTAQAIRAARQSPVNPVYNTYNTTDNRSNYQDYNGGAGAVMGGDFQIGDQIGQNTNSIGSMNTGTTTIDINGNSNSVVATNGAENTGCVDGSIGLNTVGALSPVSSMGVDITIGALQPTSPCR